jgi:hypothetical protein
MRCILLEPNNQAAAATSEKFGEIARWVEPHSLEKMSQSIKKEGD